MRATVLELLTRLEALLRHKVVDEGEVRDLLRMIRDALPAELRDAERLRGQAEQVLRAAQDEARRIVLEAQATARTLAEEHAVAREAARRGQDLVARAEQDARGIREGADAYAAGVLADLEQGVARILETIRRGRELLKESAGSAYNEQSGSSR